MKLFIVAALVSVAAAARLEHLERGYLPPDHSHGQGSFGFGQGIGARSSFGSGSQGAFGSHDSNSIDSAGAGTRNQHGSAFPSSSLTQYLPPDHGPSGSGSQFSGSLNGFQRSQPQQQYTPQSFGGSSSLGSFGGSSSAGSFGGASQYSQNQYGSASSSNGQSRYPYNSGSQFPSANHQYLAPKSSFQNIPQQAFDEQTGYHY